MKTKLTLISAKATLFMLISLILLCGCKKKRPEPNYYKNLFSGKILNKVEFTKFRDSLYQKQFDTLTGDKSVILHFEELSSSNDSIIQSFKYSIRVGMKYIVRESIYKKIGMIVPRRTFSTLDGDSIQIGGRQTKPMLINLWFVGCTGCVREMPELNKIREKYADKVNFVAMTFNDENEVSEFLNRKEFNYKHVVNAQDFIQIIGSEPYPENIFISKEGKIEFIEGGVFGAEVKYFESILEKLLSVK